MTYMTPSLRAKGDASRHRIVTALHKLHTERAAGCTEWSDFTIPAYRGQTMGVEGCERHGIVISRAAS